MIVFKIDRPRTMGEIEAIEAMVERIRHFSAAHGIQRAVIVDSSCEMKSASHLEDLIVEHLRVCGIVDDR